MPDIDNLAINIQTKAENATSEISNLTKSLDTLINKLNSVKFDSFSNLSKSFSDFTSVINKADTNKIDKLTTSLEKLSNQTNKLSELSNKIGTEKITDNASKAEKAIKVVATELANLWGITDKSTLNVLRQQFLDLANSYAGIGNIDTAFQKLSDTLKNNAKIADDSKKAYKDLLDYVKSTNSAYLSGTGNAISLGFNPSEFSDDYKNMRATAGAAFTSQVGAGNGDFENYINGLNSALGNIIPIGNTAADTFKNFVDVLKMARDSTMSFGQAVSQGFMGADTIDESIIDSLNRVRSTINVLKESQKEQSQTRNPFQNLADSLNSLGAIDTSNLSKISRDLSKLNELNTSSLQSTADSIAKLANGLNLLNSINYNSDNAKNTVKALSQFGNSSLNKAIANLTPLSDGLSRLSQVGSINIDATTFGNFIVAIRGLGSRNIQQAITNLTPLSDGLNRLASVGQIPDIATALLPLINILTTASGIRSNPLVGLINAIQTLANLNVSQATQNARDVYTTLTTLINTINNLPPLTYDVTPIANLVTSISSLSGARITRATANIPSLTTALSDMIRQLSTLPRVNSSVIALINALGNLNNAGNNNIRALNNLGNQSQRASKHIDTLASGIRKLYATMLSFVRITQKLTAPIKSAMNYLEVLNYFNAAFTQVARNIDTSDFAQQGYASAEEYTTAFTEKLKSGMKEVTAQMTGYNINDDGTLTSTGKASLGLNPTSLMNYQATFGQMASSMGVAANNATLLSEVLSKLGADLASVKNMDFDKVWNDMASGMVGMSRTLDKYGTNIRVANLQNELYKRGINANINTLNQQDKALLRTIVLLDSTRYAWGDLANTLGQPANQLRVLKSSWENLSRTIGNLFLPVVQKVLPYVSALMIALQRLFDYIGKLFGVELVKVTSQGNFNIEGLADSIYNVEDGLDGASKAADKLQKGTRAFDELKVINGKDDSGGSSGTGSVGGTGGLLDTAFQDIASEYLSVWEEAYNKLQNKAEELADSLMGIFQPVKELLEDIALGDWFSVGEDVSNIVIGIFDFFTNALDKVQWEEIGNKVGDFLRGIKWDEILNSVGELIWKAINSAVDFWKGSFDKAPFETTILTTLALLNFTPLGGILAKNISQALSPILTNILPLLTTFGTVVSGIVLLVGGLTLAIAGFVKMWNEGFSWLGEAMLIIGSIIAGVALVILGVPAGIAAAIAVIAAVIGTIVIVVKDHWTEIKAFFEIIFLNIGTFFLAIKNKFEELKKNIKEKIDAVILVFTSLVVAVKDKWQAIKGEIENKVKAIIIVFVSLGLAVKEKFNEIKNKISETWNNIKQDSSTKWNNIKDTIKEKANNAKDNAVNSFNTLKNNISTAFTDLDNSSKQKWNNIKTNISNFASEAKDKARTAFDNLKTEGGNIWDNISSKIGDTAKGIVDNLQNEFGGNAFSIVSDTFDKIKNKMTEAIDNAKDNIDRAIQAIKDFFDFDLSLPEIKLPKMPHFTIEGSFSLNPPSVPHIGVEFYAQGGFPEDGWFRASQGEIMGTFDNGQSVVANNYQITKGIAEAVYPAVYNAVSTAIKNNSGTTTNGSTQDIRVYIGDRELTDIVIDGINKRTYANQKSPLAFLV